MADNTVSKGKESAPLGVPEADSSADAPPQSTSEGVLPAEHWTEAPQEDDGDSAVGDDFLSSTASISSSIRRYRTILGRTYHSEQGNVHYWGSNDETHMEAMDLSHHTFGLVLDGKLHLAQLDEKKLHKVLDVGTGTGIWAIDFADEHPEAEIIGTDVSPIQPTWVPPNVRFEIEDCTQPWTFEPNSFDFIHMRFLVGSIDDWYALMQRAFNACKPGGIIESREPSVFMESDDGTVTNDMALGQWGKLFAEGGRKFGRSFEVHQEGIVPKALEAAGFVDLKEVVVKVPIGSWPQDPKLKELGQFTKASFLQDPEGYILFFANAMGWRKEEIDVYNAHLRKELRDPKVHGFYRQRLVWAKKPEG